MNPLHYVLIYVVNKLKDHGFDDQYIIDRLLELDFHKEDILEELKDREYRIEMGKKLQEYLKDVECIDDHNEYGIPMINSDDDW